MERTAGLGTAPLALFAGLVPVAYAAGFFFLRPLGAGPLLLALAAAAAAMCLSRRPFLLGWPYLAFAAWASAILALSLAGLMPDGWTRYHSAPAAMRQWLWVPALPIVVASTYLALLPLMGWIRRRALVLMVAAFVVSRLARNLTSLEVDPVEQIFIYTMTSDNVLVVLLFLVWFYRERRSLGLGLVSHAALFAMSNSSQSQILVLIFAAIWLLGRPASVVTGAGLALLGFILIAPFHVEAINAADPNAGIRALMWRDALRAVVETGGLGVGFGTEAITNDFTEIRPREWLLTEENSEDRLFIATHSSFYDVLLRTGLPGALMILGWLVAFCFTDIPRAGRARQLFCAIVGVFLVSNSINIGLSSINFLFGSAFCLAALVLVRDTVEEEPTR